MNLGIYSFNIIMMLLFVLFVLIASAQVGIMPNVMVESKTSECIQYEAKQKLIHINCKSIHLSDINEQLNNASILHSESNHNATDADTANGKVWILNAGIVIEKGGGL